MYSKHVCMSEIEIVKDKLKITKELMAKTFNRQQLDRLNKTRVILLEQYNSLLTKGK